MNKALSIKLFQAKQKERNKNFWENKYEKLKQDKISSINESLVAQNAYEQELKQLKDEEIQSLSILQQVQQKEEDVYNEFQVLNNANEMDELKSLRKENPSENKILGISRDYSKRSFLNESEQNLSVRKMLSVLESNDNNNLNIDINNLSREIQKLKRNSSDVLRNYNNIQNALDNIPLDEQTKEIFQLQNYLSKQKAENQQLNFRNMYFQRGLEIGRNLQIQMQYQQFMTSPYDQSVNLKKQFRRQ